MDIKQEKPLTEKTEKPHPLSAMPKSKHIVVDTEACGGCLTCEFACSARHFEGVCNADYSAIQIGADMLDYHFDAAVCRQCRSASCVAVCKKGALKFDEHTGASYVDKELCIGCGLCVKACPFSDEKNPLIRRVRIGKKQVIVKCDLCHGFEDGPLCIKICPKQAVSLK